MKYDRSWAEREFARKAKLKFLFFWGHRPTKDGKLSSSCFSQWWPAPFMVHGRRYPTAEHWMMTQKALLFKDEQVAEHIGAAMSPKQAKELGRKVTGFDDATWNGARYRIVLDGCLAKFGQDENLREYLRQTEGKVLVEASPVDRIWGIGLAADDPQANNPLLWRGLNLLGFALMETRDLLAR
jgi:ribA/ribD-fused uncharacterized protein